MWTILIVIAVIAASILTADSEAVWLVWPSRSRQEVLPMHFLRGESCLAILKESYSPVSHPITNVGQACHHGADATDAEK